MNVVRISWGGAEHDVPKGLDYLMGAVAAALLPHCHEGCEGCMVPIGRE